MVDEKEKKDFQSLVGKIEDRVELEGKQYEMSISNELIGLRIERRIEIGEGLVTKHRGLTASEDISIDKVGIEGTGTFKGLVEELKEVREDGEEWKR